MSVKLKCIPNALSLQVGDVFEFKGWTMRVLQIKPGLVLLCGAEDREIYGWIPSGDVTLALALGLDVWRRAA